MRAKKVPFPIDPVFQHHLLQQSVDDLHKAISNYYEGLKKQREFKKRGIKVNPDDSRSGRRSTSGGARRASAIPTPRQIKFSWDKDEQSQQLSLLATAGDRIFLPKAGWVRVVRHRPITGKVKNVTVSTIAGDWFVSVQTEQEVAIPVNRGSAVEVDIGSVQPIVFSTGRCSGSCARHRRSDGSRRTRTG